MEAVTIKYYLHFWCANSDLSVFNLCKKLLVLECHCCNDRTLLLYVLDYVILYNSINHFHRKPAELLEIGSVLQDKIPVVKRFSGGGTVIVDHQTVFITFICNTDALPSVQPYPRPIMSWSGQLYSKVFQGVGDFSLRENGNFFAQ